MSIKIALAGNPNCGKTTMFNDLTGSSQFVGNWPGVTVEKKEGRLKGHRDVIITDLPGIYSLSPYTLEEVVTRNYLIQEKPDVILNLTSVLNRKPSRTLLSRSNSLTAYHRAASAGTAPAMIPVISEKRNLYLTTQLTEMGIPVVIALNMMDIVRKNGDRIDTQKLSEMLGCEVVETSAIKGEGSLQAAERAVQIAQANGGTACKRDFD